LNPKARNPSVIHGPQIINVSSNATPGPGWVKDIKEALKAINETGTIRIFNGTYYDPIEIDKSVHILGENNSTTRIIANGCKGVLISRGENISIENISIIYEGDVSKSATGIHVKSKGDFTLINSSIKGFSCGIMINESRNITLIDNYISSSGEANYHCIPNAVQEMMDRNIKNCSIGIIFNMGSIKSLNALIEKNKIELDKNLNSSLITLGICFVGDSRLFTDKQISWANDNSINVTYRKTLLFDGKYDYGIHAEGGS
jgi:parallel beta-helix repeat protein